MKPIYALCRFFWEFNKMCYNGIDLQCTTFLPIFINNWKLDLKKKIFFWPALVFDIFDNQLYFFSCKNMINTPSRRLLIVGRYFISGNSQKLIAPHPLLLYSPHHSTASFSWRLFSLFWSLMTEHQDFLVGLIGRLNGLPILIQ